MRARLILSRDFSTETVTKRIISRFYGSVNRYFCIFIKFLRILKINRHNKARCIYTELYIYTLVYTYYTAYLRLV